MSATKAGEILASLIDSGVGFEIKSHYIEFSGRKLWDHGVTVNNTTRSSDDPSECLSSVMARAVEADMERRSK